MAKLYFRYGAMNCGKTTALMQVAYNYEERDQKVLVIKSAVDIKGDKNLVSRLGIERKVDVLLALDEKLEDYKINYSEISCILVDEAQFLTPIQITELWVISKLYDVPVISYGLRTDFQTNSFPGSKRLMELADEMEELVTICRCGKSAKFNGRKVNDEFVSEGDQVAIDETDNVTYESLCGKCYLDKVLVLEK
ncbi:MAG: thymidine kinase [Bacilli bacterium]|nr:thymidine kinase [Bacilli bacterium]MDD4282243.1 thymidine kinase [Bacilli bacterium]MDD4718623.1 thymidine kinase [Bacilli bacterium]